MFLLDVGLILGDIQNRVDSDVAVFLFDGLVAFYFFEGVKSQKEFIFVFGHN